ncbi:MAG: metallophosphoesterase [Acidobacteria bacterium]|nr:metallophosphoesterase [Acidobacteriota bacterium]
MMFGRRAASFFVVLLSLVTALPAQSRPPAASDSQVSLPPPRTLPMQEGTTRFAVLGDMGTGGTRQRETARTMSEVQSRFPFTFVITVGDNIYGGQGVEDMERKFYLPYKPLLDRGVTFHASLGNHDELGQRFYKLFNMGGERYYTFTRGPVQFFALDSTLMTREQLNWLELGLERSTSPWKIAYFHHPLYSSGRRHGPQIVLRGALEPLLGSYGTQVVFAGHEHFYERLTSQRGIQHFIAGSGGQLRKGNIRRSSDTAAGFDTDNAFMVVEVNDDDLYFETISRQGETVDAGVVGRTGGIRTTTQ